MYKPYANHLQNPTVGNTVAAQGSLARNLKVDAGPRVACPQFSLGGVQRGGVFVHNPQAVNHP